jgi:hypothetical protein
MRYRPRHRRLRNRWLALKLILYEEIRNFLEHYIRIGSLVWLRWCLHIPDSNIPYHHHGLSPFWIRLMSPLMALVGAAGGVVSTGIFLFVVVTVVCLFRILTNADKKRTARRNAKRTGVFAAAPKTGTRRKGAPARKRNGNSRQPRPKPALDGAMFTI